MSGSPHHRLPSSNGTLSSRYSNGTSNGHGHQPFLPRLPAHLVPNGGLERDYDGYHEYTIPNPHPSNYSNNKLRFDPKMQLVLSNDGELGSPTLHGRGHHGPPPPMILHYEYDYPDNDRDREHRSKHGTHHRVKQVPSVLV